MIDVSLIVLNTGIAVDLFGGSPSILSNKNSNLRWMVELANSLLLVDKSAEKKNI
jgi:hypothetical protein